MTSNPTTSTPVVIPNLGLVAGRPVASSLDVAKVHGKRHDNVLQAIANLEVDDEFRLLNFKESSYINSQNKEQPMVNMTRDGYTVLVMGFTGKSAMKFKLAYIEAFNAMEAQLSSGSPSSKKAIAGKGHPEMRLRHSLPEAIIIYAHSESERSGDGYNCEQYVIVEKIQDILYENFDVDASIKDIKKGLSALNMTTSPSYAYVPWLGGEAWLIGRRPHQLLADRLPAMVSAAKTAEAPRAIGGW